MIGGFYQGLARGEGYIYLYAIPNNEIDHVKINYLLEDFLINVDSQITEEKLKLEKNIITIVFMEWMGY